MVLSTLDYVIIVIFFTIVMGIGVWASRRSKGSTSDFFLSGRNMPWWLLGISMVATTFSTDTPNLVTQIVRQHGVAGNWLWWAFLLTGMLTVFVYARLWRKSGVRTDLEFYELRYGGRAARFLRGFRALYLGFFFNAMAMATVALAAIKIGQVMLGFSPLQTIGIASIITVFFSILGGFRGVVYTDFLLFFVAMVGTIGTAYYCINLPQIGGLSALLSHESVIHKVDLIPPLDDTTMIISLLLIPLAVQWWSSWYPGAEPGGGGYVAQRMLAAKNESHAIGSTFFFNLMHYAIRPWPWILVALASLVIFPDLESLRTAFPMIEEDKLGHDLAYPAMLTFLPVGWVGLMVASLTAAYISTISTHLNWGSSYIVHDFYREHIRTHASEKELVLVARITTLVLMIVSAALALVLNDALQLFEYILMFGAGTGLIFILRWFWWRVNAWSEISAMFSSGIIALMFKVDAIHQSLFYSSSDADRFFAEWMELPLSVLITTVVWLVVTLITPPEADEVLIRFYKKIKPEGVGWAFVLKKIKKSEPMYGVASISWSILLALRGMVLGCILVYAMLFGVGEWIYGNTWPAVAFSLLFITCGLLLRSTWIALQKKQTLLDKQ